MQCLNCSREISTGTHCQDCKERLSRFYLNEARSLLKFHDYEKALIECEKAATVAPDSKEIRDFKKEVEKKINNFKEYVQEAEMLQGKGKYKEAVELYHKALEIDPTRNDVRMKIDMAKIYIVTDKTPPPPERKNKIRPEEWVHMEEAFHMGKGFFAGLTLIIFISLLVLGHLYVRSQKIRVARQLFERISTNLDARTYWEYDFTDDFEELMGEFKGTEYAEMAKTMFQDKYGKAKRGIFDDFMEPVEILVASGDKTQGTQHQGEEKKVKFSEEVAVFMERGTYLLEHHLYEDALVAFTEAYAIAASDEKPKIQRFISKTERIVKERQGRYEEWIERAKQFEARAEYSKAIEAYSEALKFNAQDEHSLDRMDYIKQTYLSSPLRMFFKKARYYISVPIEETKGFYRKWSQKRNAKKTFVLEQKGGRFRQEKNYLAMAKTYKRLANVTRQKKYRDKAILLIRVNDIAQRAEESHDERDLVQLGYLYKRLRHRKEYLQVYQLIRNLENKSILSYLFIIDEYTKSGDVRTAAKLYRKLLQRYPCAFLEYHLAVVLREGGAGEAERFLRRAHEVYPQQIEFAITLVHLYLEGDKVKMSQEVLRPAEEMNLKQLSDAQVCDPFFLEETFCVTSRKAVFIDNAKKLVELYFKTGRVSSALRGVAFLQSLQ